MQIDQSVVDALVAQPAEGLTVEVKRWIDPSANPGIEKIVKATLALRNRNGGYLVIGFDDGTLLPNLGSEPANVRDAFHLYVICRQSLDGALGAHNSEETAADLHAHCFEQLNAIREFIPASLLWNVWWQ